MDILNTKIKSILTEKNTKIKPENIKKDVNILGVTGTYEGGGSQAVLPDGIKFSESTSSDMSWLADVDFSSIRTMSSMFYSCIQLTTIPLIDTSHVTNMSYCFQGCILLTSVPALSALSATTLTSMFYNCNLLETAPLVDTQNVTSMSSMFYNCYRLSQAPSFNTSSVTIMSSMFSGCSGLTTVPAYNTSSVTTMANMFSGCTHLSNDSLNNILTMCANATSYTKTKTLKAIGLTSAQATTCTGLSNWASAQSAGWTTGY